MSTPPRNEIDEAVARALASHRAIYRDNPAYADRRRIRLTQPEHK